MKIAIQGHPTRGHEVIQILKSLGGKNKKGLNGSKEYWYFINSDGYIRNDYKSVLQYKGFKTYTLEEFEKEFPFKIGDKVKDCSDNEIGTILRFIDINGELIYVVKFEKSGYGYMPAKELKPYKEMKEERNITLTLEKAKEWYKKGGELREIALQAFTEKELISLPRSWEEFCDNYMIDDSEAFFDTCSEVCIADKTCRHSLYDRNMCPSKKSAEAHLAMIQLEQLRDCWRQDWKSSRKDTGFSIKIAEKGLAVYSYYSIEFLSFPTKEMAEEFLKCFRDLIEKAGDLI